MVLSLFDFSSLKIIQIFNKEAFSIEQSFLFVLFKMSASLYELDVAYIKDKLVEILNKAVDAATTIRAGQEYENSINARINVTKSEP